MLVTKGNLVLSRLPDTHLRFVFVLAATLLALPECAAQDSVTISASATTGGLHRRLATAHARSREGARRPLRVSDSKSPLTDLVGGSADVALSTRALTRAELATLRRSGRRRPIEVTLSLEAVAVHVHEHNPVPSLTVAQLRGILRGEIRNWRQVGGRDRRIDIYEPGPKSELGAWVRERLLAGAKLANRTRAIPSHARLTAAVSRNQSAIGFGPAGYVRGARMVRLRDDADTTAVRPSRENVGSGRYPLTRTLRLYAAPAADDTRVRRFLNWVAGPRGRETVLRAGACLPPSGDAAVAARRRSR